MKACKVNDKVNFHLSQFMLLAKNLCKRLYANFLKHTYKFIVKSEFKYQKKNVLVFNTYIDFFLF